MTLHTVSRPLAVKVLIFLDGFLGINGLVGGILFLLAPDGHLLGMPFSYVKNSPFPDFTIPGLLLTVFLGLYPLAAAYSLWKLPDWRWPEAINPLKKCHWSWAGSMVVGAIAVIWILVQIQWVRVGALHVFILSLGIVIVAVTLLRSVRAYCRR